MRWDRPGKLNSHSAAVQELEAIGLTSAYHARHGLRQGDERHPTLYWRSRQKDGPCYHIDYCFVPSAWLPFLSAVEVGEFEDWVATRLSDHVPLAVELSFPGEAG